MSGGFRSRSAAAKKSQPDRRKQDAHKHGARKHTARKPQASYKHSDVDKPRLVAFEVLNRVSDDDAYANLILPKALREANLQGRDAAFATEITYGTLRSLGIVDTVIAQCSSRDIDNIATPVLSALRLGAYQLLFTRVDHHAAVDTSVRLVESAGHLKAKGFANGILRTISRTSPDSWLEQLSPADELGKLAFMHAHPEWIARSFNSALWEGQASKEIHPELEEALHADSQRPVVHLVARPGEITAEELALSIGGELGNYSPYAVYMDSGGNPGSLEPVQQGLAAVQDEGSQLIARALAEAELRGSNSGRWLDLCAGPGGKAALLGALARIDGAHLDAVEISEHRARLISQTVRDLPVTVHVADGRDSGLESGYDRVLIDAPCSGLGALRRRPEARWRKDDSQIAELAQLQYELLSAGLKLVRPGGVVVYSTCSPDLRETRKVIDRVLAKYQDDPELAVTETATRQLIPDMEHSTSSETFSIDVSANANSTQMWPHRHGTDAMFLAALRREPTASESGID